MTEEKQNIAIYKFLGYQPVKSWRFFHDREKSRGPFGFRTKKDALEAIERDKNSWPYTQYPQEYEFSEPEEYDDWFHCPNVNLDLLNMLEKKAYDDNPAGFSFSYNEYLTQVTSKSHDPLEYNWNWHAKASQRREALLKALGLWED